MIASGYYPTQFLGGPIANAQTVDHPKELDPTRHKLLVLWGGEDISPSLYKQKSVRSNAGDTPSRRDMAEVNLARRAQALGIPILGICRGAQLLCALGGGALYQHVTGHSGTHTLYTKDGKEFDGNSCHHQMMIPTPDMEVLAWVTCRSPKKWMDQNDPVEHTAEEPEIVHMPLQKAIGVQGHPEWMPYHSNFVKYVRNLVGELYHVEI